MIDEPSTYGDNPLLQEIRKTHGTIGTVDEGTPDARSDVQDELRSGEQTGREPGNVVTNGSDQSTRGNGPGQPVERVIEGRDSGKRRPSATPDQDYSRFDGSDGSTHATIPDTKLTRKLAELNKKNPKIGYAAAARAAGCSVTSATNYLKVMRAGDSDEIQPEDKPAGLSSKPHPKEQAIRQEQQEQQARATSEKSRSSATKGLFSLINGSKSKERPKKEGIRSKPFSEEEAKAVKPAFLAALLDYFKYTDEFIYATHKAHNTINIWASIDEEEAEILVDVWLAQAKRSAKAAGHITHVVNSHTQLQVGIILAPRFYQTFRAYVDGGGFSVR